MGYIPHRLVRYSRYLLLAAGGRETSGVYASLVAYVRHSFRYYGVNARLAAAYKRLLEDSFSCIVCCPGAFIRPSGQFYKLSF